MTEICKLCGEPSTPWEYMEALDGHICADCSYRIGWLHLESIGSIIEVYGTKAWNEAVLP